MPLSLTDISRNSLFSDELIETSIAPPRLVYLIAFEIRFPKAFSTAFASNQINISD